MNLLVNIIAPGLQAKIGGRQATIGEFVDHILDHDSKGSAADAAKKIPNKKFNKDVLPFKDTTPVFDDNWSGKYYQAYPWGEMDVSKMVDGAKAAPKGTSMNSYAAAQAWNDAFTKANDHYLEFRNKFMEHKEKVEVEVNKKIEEAKTEPDEAKRDAAIKQERKPLEDLEKIWSRAELSINTNLDRIQEKRLTDTYKNGLWKTIDDSIRNSGAKGYKLSELTGDEKIAFIAGKEIKYINISKLLQELGSKADEKINWANKPSHPDNGKTIREKLFALDTLYSKADDINKIYSHEDFIIRVHKSVINNYKKIKESIQAAMDCAPVVKRK